MFIEGARWDVVLGTIGDSLLKDLHPLMPIMYIRAITQDKQETRNLYECPVYKTRQRGPTYIWTFNFQIGLFNPCISLQKPFVVRGALFCFSH